MLVDMVNLVSKSGDYYKAKALESLLRYYCKAIF